jgi:hypothetical protein
MDRVEYCEAAGAIGQAELTSTLGLEGFSYGCTVLPVGAFSFPNLGPLVGGPFLLRWVTIRDGH